MLSVESLVADCGLELVAGEAGAGRAIRWVHASELEDPTRFLSGGELLLTTGISLTDPAAQRAFVARLDEHGASGLGFATEIVHPSVPEAILSEASERGLPVFEVPYEKPFIEITEKAFARIVNEQHEALERASSVNARLERLVIEGRGLEAVVGEIALAVGGTAVVCDASGAERLRRNGARPPEAATLQALGEALGNAAGRPGGAASFDPALDGLEGRALAVPVPGRGAGPIGWLTVVSDMDGLGEFELMTARQAALVIGLELMRERVVRETERRLAGDLLADALAERLDGAEALGRLRPFGIGGRASVALFATENPSAAEPALEKAFAAEGVAALVATSEVGGSDEFLCALIDAAHEPIETVTAARRKLQAALGREVRAAASRPADVGSLRRAFHEARCALEATSFANGDAPEVASHRDLGAFTLLLALQDDEALRLYSDGLLDPIERTEGEYGGELLRSLEAFIENNGNWERAARSLYCHRHTLRYRIRKIEELTDRDLGRATDRIELWLALRARELVR
ncbi:PucR family transcriptional regulator [Thermoleophilia bacterium SCSIO 60948]|nr:PucR family transcriptional regulator [Thermoleophilia bacterium SCSIO 60948]